MPTHPLADREITDFIKVFGWQKARESLSPERWAQYEALSLSLFDADAAEIQPRVQPTQTQEHTKMASDWEGEGYDHAGSGDGGIFLGLKNKGDEIRIRFVTGPFRYEDTIDKKDEKTGHQVTEKIRRAAWGVINKYMDANNQPVFEPRIFRGGMFIYKALKELNDDPDWGDPSGFDVKIKRTEAAGAYYSVLGVPNTHKPTPPAHLNLAHEAKVGTVADVRDHVLRVLNRDDPFKGDGHDQPAHSGQQDLLA